MRQKLMSVVEVGFFLLALCLLVPPMRSDDGVYVDPYFPRGAYLAICMAISRIASWLSGRSLLVCIAEVMIVVAVSYALTQSINSTHRMFM